MLVSILTCAPLIPNENLLSTPIDVMGMHVFAPPFIWWVGEFSSAIMGDFTTANGKVDWNTDYGIVIIWPDGAREPSYPKVDDLLEQLSQMAQQGYSWDGPTRTITIQ